MRHARRFVIPAALALLVLAAYGLSLRNGFVYDDNLTVVDNALIKDWRTWPDLFSRRYFLLAQEASYRPVVTLTYYLDYAVWGRNPAGFHLTNLLLHLAAVLLLYYFAAGVLRAPRVAAWAAALFATHPMLSEAVNAISFREDLLALVFMLAALLCLPMAQRGGRGRTWGVAAALLATALALLSKEMAVTLPILAMLVDAARGAPQWAPAVAGARPVASGGQRPRRGGETEKRSLSLYVGLFALSVAYLILRFGLLRASIEPQPLPAVGWPARLLTSAKITLANMLQMLWPADMSPDYRLTYATAGDLLGWAALGMVLLTLLGVLRLWRRQPLLALGPAWFFVALAPVSNLAALAQPKADRYLYVPAVGFCLFAPSLLHHLLGRRPAASPPGDSSAPRGAVPLPPAWLSRRLMPLLLLATLACYLPLSAARSAMWRDSVSLWRRAASSSRPTARALINFAYGSHERRSRDRAHHLFLRAALLEPRSAAAWSNLAYLMMERGRNDRAVILAARALRSDPTYALGHLNFGVLLERRGRLRGAIRRYLLSTALHPGYQGAYHNLGVVFGAIGQQTKALAALRHAQYLRRDHPATANLIADTLYRLGLHERALTAYRYVLALQPQDARVRQNVLFLERQFGRK
ncbi:MAG: hypothetical protein HYY96_07120 [Candidatus Tectomicrobia bacterium]|nr:hypothetical protein [Candidatus Tectomicrobia bacterium]